MKWSQRKNSRQRPNTGSIINLKEKQGYKRHQHEFVLITQLINVCSRFSMRRDQTTASKIEAFRNQFIYRPLRAMELAVAFQELLRFPCRNWFYIFGNGLCSWSFSIIQARWTTWHLKRDRCLIEFVTSISIRRELVENIAGAAAAAISWGAGVNSI